MPTSNIDSTYTSSFSLHRIANSVTQILEEIVSDNQSDKEYSQVLQKQHRLSFSAKRNPAVSVLSYLERIIKYSKIEESTLILALMYIDKLCELSDLILTHLNVHR